MVLPTKILFVCMGNICRSPTAHGLFLSLIGEGRMNEIIEVDSAGTHSWKVGCPPDISAQMTAKKYGVDISELHARRISSEDYDYYDYIVAMDNSNLENMLAVCHKQNRYKLKLLLDYAEESELAEVPDPYGEGIDGFETVYSLIEQGCCGLLRDLIKEITTEA